MKHLFSVEGEAALAATMAREPLLAFDFDGTLAAIVARPDDARVTAAVARRLELLARRLPVAIISGRGVEDVRGRLDFQPHFILGNHGAEDPLAGQQFAPPSELQEIRARLHGHADELHANGVVVEDKAYSIAVHYRLARDRQRAFDLVTRLVSGLGPEVRVFGGKMVVNLAPAQAPDKGQALARVVQRCGAQAALFVGDDINDEAVFARGEPSWLTVRIGRDDPGSKALFVLDSFGEVATMLDRMLASLDRAA